MIKVAVYNIDGKEIESLKVDEAILGGTVRYPLLKQAIVMYHANKRVGTATNKGRSMVAGSTKKLFRQKGTGNARVGNRRTGKRVGGGVTFAKVPRDFGKGMPRKQKRLARDSAILAKLLSKSVIVIDGLNMEKPGTKVFTGILKNLKIDRSCLVTLIKTDETIVKSARNIPKIAVMPVNELNAGDICNYSKILFTKDALLSVLNRDETSEN
jgi:large subunit ribosomal protein L4